MKTYKIVLCLMSIPLSFLFVSCDKNEDASSVTLIIASSKGKSPMGAEWFWVKEYGSSTWMTFAFVAGFDNYEEGYEYYVKALKTYPDRGEAFVDGYRFKYQVTRILSKTKKETEGLPDYGELEPL